MPIRVAVVDDQPIIRSGLNAFVMADPQLALIGEAANGEDAIELCERFQPDVVLMDLKMPVMDGLSATRILHANWPNVQTLILSNSFEKGLEHSVMEAGACGYLIKDITADELSRAILKAHHERKPVTQRMLADQGHSLETIRHDFVDQDLDPSRLAGLLRKRLPGILPNCEIEARIFPDKELLTFPAEGIHILPEAGWRWTQSQTGVTVIASGKEFPWGGDQLCPCDLIVAPMLSEGGFGLGGLAVWSAGTGDELSALLSVVDGLRPLLARAMSQALGTSRQVVSHNVAEQLAAAARIQIDLLPARMPRLSGWDLAARLEPALETSGDFYDLIPLANNHWGLVIADVSDKGMGAALFMALASTLIRTYAKQYPTLPALSVSTVNERILSDSRSGMFVTAFYAVLDPFSGRMRYVNAGHNPPILVSHQKSKTTDWLPSTGMALGVMGDIIWKQKVRRLLPGDLMVMYTDGVTDAQNPRGEYYGEQRLLNVVRRCGCSAQETLDAIMQDLQDFTGGYPQGDDITLLVIRRDSRN